MYISAGSRVPRSCLTTLLLAWLAIASLACTEGVPLGSDPDTVATQAETEALTPALATFVGIPVTATVMPGPTWVLPIPKPTAWPSVEPDWRYDPSPDGAWLVRSYTGPTLPITDAAGSVTEWYYRAQQLVSADRVLTHSLVDEWSMMGLGFPSPDVLGWAPERDRVYLVETGWADGCDLFGWAKELRAVDLPSGQVTWLAGFLYAPSPSPDMRHLVFSRADSESGDRIVVKDLRTGRETATPFGQRSGPNGLVEVGAWRWSPSGNRVAFTFAPEPCQTEGVGVLDLAGASVTIIQPPAPGDSRVTRWDGENAILVRSNPLAYTYTEGRATPPPSERRVEVPMP